MQEEAVIFKFKIHLLRKIQLTAALKINISPENS